ALPELKQRGFKLYANEQPHVWPWQFSRVEGSPWNDIRVRKAAGMKIVDNVTPHVWNYHLSVLPGSPWTDIRLRKALNLAIN
ncbi:hypothetical protein G8O24_43610, partial [Bradyrhizobium sp. INPA01-394B]|uniref:hypothetical protein n=1 Tax=Bradyrhizobium campsiandrae TaxID=1729892 RepID=UPI00165FBDD4